MNPTAPLAPAIRWRALGRRFVALGLLWAVLNGADVRSWLVGIPAVAIAAWISLRLPRSLPWSFAPAQVLPFTRFFLWESLRGGWDVAWRAVHPRLPIAPGFVNYGVRLPTGSARTFFAGCVSLLPGTCVVRMTAEVFEVHLLNRTPEALDEMRRLESQVAALFKVPLCPPEGGST